MLVCVLVCVCVCVCDLLCVWLVVCVLVVCVCGGWLRVVGWLWLCVLFVLFAWVCVVCVLIVCETVCFVGACVRAWVVLCVVPCVCVL